MHHYLVFNLVSFVTLPVFYPWGSPRWYFLAIETNNILNLVDFWIIDIDPILGLNLVLNWAWIGLIKSNNFISRKYLISLIKFKYFFGIYDSITVNHFELFYWSMKFFIFIKYCSYSGFSVLVPCYHTKFCYNKK